MVNPTRDKSGSKLVPALRTRLAASRDNPPCAVGAVVLEFLKGRAVGEKVGEVSLRAGADACDLGG